MSFKFANKKIAILGYGIENQALLKWLIKHGATNITICDRNVKLKVIGYKLQVNNFKFQTGENYLKNLADFDIIFRTPGIPYLDPEIQKALRLRSGQAKKKGVEISSQIKLFFELCSAKIIGITGTKGKGTTVSLITAILKSKIKNQKSKIWTGGNIGNPPIEFLDNIKSDDIVVLELSSFQLQDMTKSPHIAVVLDIKSDHLDYHKDQKEYEEAKANIVRHQTKGDYAVINHDYLTAFKFAAISPTENDYYFSRRKSVDLGCFVRWKNNDFGTIILRTPTKDYEIIDTRKIILRGKHNLENISAAITASYLAGATIKAIRSAIRDFKGLEHRLEFVAELKGVKYYNDSFSTTPDTAIAAIKSFKEPIILLAGGSEKNANYSELGKEIAKSSVKTIILIGKTGSRIIESLQPYSHKTIKVIKGRQTMGEVVTTAKKEARDGDVVLLSPASASFDRYKNYKDRGNQFKKAVREIR